MWHFGGILQPGFLFDTFYAKKEKYWNLSKDQLQDIINNKVLEELYWIIPIFLRNAHKKGLIGGAKPLSCLCAALD